MSERFFIDQPITGTGAQLHGSEAQHLARVLRAQPGDRVTLFDGSGAEFAAVVREIGRQQVTLEIVDRCTVDRELACEVTLAVALPKGDRQQWLVEKATELGVGRLVPLITQRGVAQPVETALARLRRWVIEASKQCGRNRLLQIAPPEKWPDFAGQNIRGEKWFAHPGGAACRPPAALAPAVTIAIGPEGGWTAEEAAVASTYVWDLVSLGPRILRVETAAAALAVWAGMNTSG